MVYEIWLLKERLIWEQGVGGSNPLAPPNKISKKSRLAVANVLFFCRFLQKIKKGTKYVPHSPFYQKIKRVST